jgi:hypothetical protein
VTPELDPNYNGSIFKNLYLTKRQSNYPIEKIGNFSIEIDRPSNLGDKNDEWFYMYLDLTNYNGTIQENMINHSAEIIFTVVAA